MSGLRLSPAQAWARLESGNRHWAAGRLEHPDQDLDRRLRVAARQDPFATIVSCIDSRLPPETIFDQGSVTCSPSAPVGRRSTVW